MSDGKLVLDMIMRWIHIGSATLAIGVPIYMRFVLMPAAAEALDAPAQAALREKMMDRWRIFVMAMIVLFIVSGTYWLVFVINMKEKSMLYQSILGIKLLCALALFFLASALAGRSAAFASIRANARKWTGVLVVLGIVILMCAGAMHMLPNKRPAAPTVRILSAVHRGNG